MYLSNDQREAVVSLRNYLHNISLSFLYENLLKSHRLVRGSLFPDGLFSAISGSFEGAGLAFSLLLRAGVAVESLTAVEQRIADTLVAAGLLIQDSELYRMKDYRLIVVQGLPMLIDANVMQSSGSPSRVYLGPDSFHLAALSSIDNLPYSNCVDIGTGCGLVGLCMAQTGCYVLITDVSEDALRLAAINSVLTGLEDKIELRLESCAQTLSNSVRYHRITFNPPCAAIPSELEAPIYATGIDEDGLGYCRYLMDHLYENLAIDGFAFVAVNLLGNDYEPFFIAELRRNLALRRLIIDLFSDSSYPLFPNCPFFQAFAKFLHHYNPAYEAIYCQELLEQLYLKHFKATRAYPTVLKLSLASGAEPALRC
jgi:hypothetical protein